jgi:hypothetical protein
MTIGAIASLSVVTFLQFFTRFTTPKYMVYIKTGILETKLRQILLSAYIVSTKVSGLAMSTLLCRSMTTHCDGALEDSHALRILVEDSFDFLRCPERIL